MRRCFLGFLVAASIALAGSRAHAVEVIDEFEARETRSPREREYRIAVGEASLIPRSRIVLGEFLHVHPFAGQWLGYDSNVTFADDGAPGVEVVDSAFSRTIAGVRFETFIRNDHRLALLYQALYQAYFSADEFSYLEHRLSLSGAFNFTRGYIRTEGSLVASNEPLLLDITVRRDYALYGALGYGAYQFGQFGLTLGAEWSNLDYEGRDLARLDFNEATLALQASYLHSEKLKLLLEYRFSLVRFDEPILNDFDTHHQLIGAVYELTEKLTLMAKVGLLFQRVRTSGIVTDENEFASAGGEFEARWEPREDLRLTFRYRRRADASFSSNFLEHDTLFLEAEHFITLKWLVRGDLQLDFGNPSRGSSLVRYILRADLEYHIQEWLRATVGGSISVLDSRAPDNDYKDLRAFIGLAAAF